MLHSFEERVWEWVLDQLSSDVNLWPHVLSRNGLNMENSWMLLDEVNEQREGDGREIL